MDPVLIAARLVHFASVMILFGASLFVLYTWNGPSGSVHATRSPAGNRLGALLGPSALAAAISAPVWLACVTAQMTGDPSDAIDPTSLGLVLRETHFGAVWRLQLVGCVALVLPALLAWLSERGSACLRVCLAGGLLLGVAATGHAAEADGNPAPCFVAVHAVHLMAAAAWLGGLPALAAALAVSRGGGARPAAIRILRRFSTTGIVAVCTIVATGALDAAHLARSLPATAESDWGRMLAAKLAMVAGLLAIAAVNRMVLMPRLEAGADGSSVLRRLERNVFAEQGLGVLVLLAASILGTLPPPMG